MIKTAEGNILDAPRGYIVHGCNCQGVMGSGIAAQIRERFPRVYDAYRQRHELFDLTLGDIQIIDVADQKYIINAMTQDSFGTHKRQVNYEAVALCFEKIATHLQINFGEKLPLLFPMIGAGLGGGNWKIIETIIDQTVPDSIEKILYIYKP